MKKKDMDLIDMAGAARMLDVGRARIYYLVMDGRLKVVKIRNKNYFTREELINYKKSIHHDRARVKAEADTDA